MSKDAVISEIFSLPLVDQQEIYVLLQEKLGDDLELSEEQLQELDRRFARIEKEGFHGTPWDEVYADLMKARKDAHRPS